MHFQTQMFENMILKFNKRFRKYISCFKNVFSKSGLTMKKTGAGVINADYRGPVGGDSV